ncbi:MAG: hypothetical protein ABSB74_06620 [Tepidisphaeraceae bacterium]
MRVSSKIVPAVGRRVRREGFVLIDGLEMYQIPDYGRLEPFLISVTNESDLWMYASSAGGLTAGRVDADHALFPYESVDRLHRGQGTSGAATLLRVSRDGGPAVLWEPFACQSCPPAVERNLYKNSLGNRLMFEEIHQQLGLIFRYTWATSTRFGFVRVASLVNDDDSDVCVELLDGLLNILPAGVHLAMQQNLSSLVDAYKQSELDSATGLAMYHLTATVTDRPEPSEALTATTVWSRGLADASVLLREEARSDFRQGRRLTPTGLVAGQRGAFFLHTSLNLSPRESADWDIVCDVDQDHISVSRTRAILRDRCERVRQAVREDIDRSQDNLLRIVAGVDGLQISSDRMTCAHHLTNVLFNAMRGGVPLGRGHIKAAEFSNFVRDRNLPVFTEHSVLLQKLPDTLEVAELVGLMNELGSSDLTRLAYEYLPLFFSRRHGDPSRPWNWFSIRLRNPDGSARIGYEGNWRDIFQNWEALALAYPALIDGFVAKFVNASTVDGFNPYRITSEGIDWEAPKPNDPWAHIGYWGDHQINYLLKFLELSRDFHPGRLESLLGRAVFSYANVPYRLDLYRAIVQNPREAIQWDSAEAERIDLRIAAMGADGKLLQDRAGNVYHATLLEKLLLPLLSKLSNLVPDAGIWMNTQRPEWNDANNALPGYGVSAVTLAHLRRYASFLERLLTPIAEQSYEISIEVVKWAQDLHRVLQNRQDLLEKPRFSPDGRRTLMDELGAAFEEYRRVVYANGFSGKQSWRLREALEFLKLASRYIEHSLAANWRDDGLFHSYHMLDFSGGDHLASIRHLDEMLEGQVAILSSGMIDAGQSLSLLSEMFKSRLFRIDQRSFMLYPLKELPGFLEKNVVPAEAISRSPLLSALVKASDNSLIARDADGVYRFNGNFQNSGSVKQALSRLAVDRRWKDLVTAHGPAVLRLYDEVFDHDSFTGRSQAMYAYEGIGCIYWHMVSKLLLAVQECFWRAVDQKAPAAEIDALADAYYRVRAGLEYDKTASEYGAFPTDPYSHTPLEGGARQPGMTGRVKEEILTRLGEWGLRVRNGGICFDPRLLRKRELLTEPVCYSFVALDDTPRSIDLEPGMAAFTFCQVPVVYRAAQQNSATSIRLWRSDGSTMRVESQRLDPRISQEIFQRRGTVQQLEVEFNPATLRRD